MADLAEGIVAPGGLTVTVQRDGGRVLLILDMPGTPEGLMASLDPGPAAYVGALLAAAAVAAGVSQAVPVKEADHG